MVLNEQAWYRHSGSESDVVVSTRVCMGRNLARFPFPDTADDAQRESILGIFKNIFPGESLTEVSLPELPKRELYSLVERHLISPAFLNKAEAGKGLFLSDAEDVSVMVNEEDHIRIQVMCSGLDLKSVYAKANELDTRISSKVEYAYDGDLGYLTQDPTNLGTDMRVSLMLHLPALQETRRIHLLSSTVSKLGLTIRGLYGEGSRAEGALYQLSNQVTLGITEQEAVDNLEAIALQVIREERNARNQLTQNPILEDQLWRSLGVLKTARLLTHEECSRLLSHLRMGVGMGLVDTVSMDTLCELFCEIQPATLMAIAGEDLDVNARDAKRAELVRAKLA